MLRDSVVASVVLAFAAAAVAALFGEPHVGLGLALGLLVGAANGHLIVRLFDRGGSFATTSLARLAVLSAIAIAAALLLGSQAWAVLLGVAAAQLVMVAASLRQGLRAR
jgi:hypothetical protein